MPLYLTVLSLTFFPSLKHKGIFLLNAEALETLDNTVFTALTEGGANTSDVLGINLPLEDFSIQVP